jgi:xyloglucan-specific endo-beta-1,4-glucanase
MKLIAALAPALVAASAIPTKTIAERATEICGQWDTVQTGTYTLYQDLWGIDAATSGSQCSTFESLSGDTIAWSTSWSWQGGNYNVKSFANVVVTQSTGYQVSAIKSIPSKWDYT